MKTLTVLGFIITVCLFSSYGLASNQYTDLKMGSCGHENVTISYVIKADYLIGCEGITRARNFFANFGYAVDIPIHIYFRQRVSVGDNTSMAGQEDIYGYFDPKTMSVYLSSLTSPFVTDPERMYLRTVNQKRADINKLQSSLITEEIHRSVVTHEVAHLYAQYNFNLRSIDTSKRVAKMGHGVQEYIASVVQLSTMDSTHRKSILQRYDPQVVFSYEQQINVIFYACNPQKFSIMAFRHFYNLEKSQQKVLLDRILSNELNPDLVFEFDY